MRRGFCQKLDVSITKVNLSLATRPEPPPPKQKKKNVSINCLQCTRQTSSVSAAALTNLPNIIGSPEPMFEMSDQNYQQPYDLRPDKVVET